ncbi:MAG: FtsQ-type POTRA domain-containing protein [Nitrospirae bacterium]|nr:FtsQ-type POTRA domain-containing protein [Nitrospirota bacterium]
MKPGRNVRKNTMVEKGRSAPDSFVSRAGMIATGVLPVLAVLSSVYLAAVFMKSSFTLRNMVFSGSRHLSDEDMRTLTGLKGDESLVTLKSGVVYKNMTASPWIKSVSVRKDLPDTLSIDIKEAEPFALLEMGGRHFIVDNKGRMLEEMKGGSVPFLPVIVGNPFEKKEGFAEAIDLVRAIKDSGLMTRKDRIEVIANRPQDLTVNLDGAVVKVGSGDYQNKLARFLELEDEIRTRRIPVDYIDLRFANRVVVKPVREVVR